MTKAAHREAKRLSPLGEEGVAAIFKIVEEQQYAKVNEVLVDLYSAGVFVAVYNRVNAESQAKLRAMPVAKAVDMCFKTLKRASSKS
jgi:hypothetical protein